MYDVYGYLFHDGQPQVDQVAAGSLVVSEGQDGELLVDTVIINVSHEDLPLFESGEDDNGRVGAIISSIRNASVVFAHESQTNNHNISEQKSFEC